MDTTPATDSQLAAEPTTTQLLATPMRLTTDKFRFRWQTDEGADGVLSLTSAGVSFVSEKNPEKNWNTPLSNIENVTQNMIYLKFYTAGGAITTFKSGNELQVIASLGLVGGLAGMALAGRSIEKSGISDWLPALHAAGVRVTDSAANTTKGFALRGVRIGVWTFLVCTSLAFMIAIFAAFTGQAGGVPSVLITEAIIIGGLVLALKQLPNGKRF